MNDNEREQAARLWRQISSAHQARAALGEVLRQLKQSLPRGQFQDVLQEIGVPARTATRFMKLKPPEDKTATLAVIPVPVVEDEDEDEDYLPPALKKSYAKMTKLARELGTPAPWDQDKSKP